VAPGSRGVSFSLPEGGAFTEALAGQGDEVVFGLPDPYHEEVERILLADPSSRAWDVVVAAHGRFGSSQMAFRRMTTFLLKLDELDLSNAADEDVWAAWNDAGAVWRDT
jgi:hypothetical protein